MFADLNLVSLLMFQCLSVTSIFKADIEHRSFFQILFSYSTVNVS